MHHSRFLFTYERWDRWKQWTQRDWDLRKWTEIQMDWQRKRTWLSQESEKSVEAISTANRLRPLSRFESSSLRIPLCDDPHGVPTKWLMHALKIFMVFLFTVKGNWHFISFKYSRSSRETFWKFVFLCHDSIRINQPHVSWLRHTSPKYPTMYSTMGAKTT